MKNQIDSRIPEKVQLLFKQLANSDKIDGNFEVSIVLPCTVKIYYEKYYYTFLRLSITNSNDNECILFEFFK